LGVTIAIVLLLIISQIDSILYFRNTESIHMENTTIQQPYLNFEQVGYYKGDNKLRYFTFYVKHGYTVINDSLPDELRNRIEYHGSKQMHTDGRLTASFYYFDKQNAPDITLLSAQEANDVAHERKPIMSVWIMPTGSVNTFVNPWK